MFVICSSRIFLIIFTASGVLPARTQLFLCRYTATMDDLSCCIVASPITAVVGRFINKPVYSSGDSSIAILVDWDASISVDRDSNA